jgi:uncharacterized CHY-type Zn-finger protein
MRSTIHGIDVHGVALDAETRCGHYHGLSDRVAIRFYCCREWYPCFECHASEAGHEAGVWSREEFGARAVLCGACGNQLTVQEYLDCGSTCPNCEAEFNPKCAGHYHLYFA